MGAASMACFLPSGYNFYCVQARLPRASEASDGGRGTSITDLSYVQEQFAKTVTSQLTFIVRVMRSSYLLIQVHCLRVGTKETYTTSYSYIQDRI
jgi:hypothetical protein